MFILKVEVQDRAASPRGLARVLNTSTKETWFETGSHFHSEMSDERFSHKHASLAGFAPRTKAYTSRKLKKFGHTNPLEYSGTSRNRSRTANITSTSKQVTVRYSVPAFNFKNPKARVQIDMGDEFRRVIPQEAKELASVFDRGLDRRLNADRQEN